MHESYIKKNFVFHLSSKKKFFFYSLRVLFAKSVTMHEYFNDKIVEKMEFKIFFLIYSRLGFKDI